MPWAIVAAGASGLMAARAQILAREAQERQEIAKLRALGFDEEADLRQGMLDGRIAARKQREAMAAYMAEQRMQNAARRGNVYRFPSDQFNKFGEPKVRIRVHLPECVLIREQSWWPYLAIGIECWALFIRFFG
ncbi:MAG: hypothetical protein ACR2PR_03290 [Pseudohongiellaceae bacterium]